jgi:PAS domain-containing protein
MSFAEQLASHFNAQRNILERYIGLCPIPCFIVTRKGKRIFVNDAYQKAYDVRLDQVDENQWEDLVDRSYKDLYLKAWRDLLDGIKTECTLDIKTIVNGSSIPTLVKITHVPGNGFIGYILFQCNQAKEICPFRSQLSAF